MSVGRGHVAVSRRLLPARSLPLAINGYTNSLAHLSK